MAKQLELFLNTQAAFKGVKTHYEVLEWNRKGEAFPSYANYELPPIVKKYHIDMVLGLVGHTGYMDYFMKPVTKEGIPIYGVDAEFMLKPLSKRVPPGPAADLYAIYKKKVKTDTEKYTYPGQESAWGFSIMQDPDYAKDLIEMTGRRMELLSEKIQGYRSPDGPAPKLVLFHAPFRAWPDFVADFWRDLSAQYHIPYIDLTEAYDALSISYYPAATRCCDGHYTAYGSYLVGYLLSQYLVDDNLVPFETPEPKKK
jgi:hypothetical protein